MFKEAAGMKLTSAAMVHPGAPWLRAVLTVTCAAAVGALRPSLQAGLAGPESHSKLEQQQPCATLFGAASTVTVLMVADPGGFSGMSEAHFFLAAAQNVRHVAPGATACHSVATARLLGQPAAVITTGIGQRAAASCATSLLTLCPQRIKEILFFGTAGCSVQRGGVLNSGHCGAANPSSEVTHIGDLCITPFAMDATCRMASWQQQAAGYPDACSMPQQSVGPSEERLLGKCLFASASQGSLELTAALQAAAAAAMGAYPAKPGSLLQYEESYWSNMAAGTGVQYNLTAAQPSVYDMRTCAETDSNFFFEGVPYDMQARAGVATLISKAVGNSVVPQDVIAVSTMEAVGLLHAMDVYHAAGHRPIPYTVLRTCSDYLHSPVVRRSDGSWKEVTKPEYDMAAGYRHAIATGSTAILRLLQQRCLEAGGDERGHACCSQSCYNLAKHLLHFSM